MSLHPTVLRFSLVMTCLLATGAAAVADEWPTWRGPYGNGVASDGDYPISWTPEKNVVWKVKLDGRGASTPIVWGDRIFLTLGHDEKNVLMCLDRAGKTLWQVDLGQERGGKHRKASGSNPSCVTDGETVYAYFKSGDLAAVDFSGRVLWQHNLQSEFGEDTLWWDLGTSPVLSQRDVIVAVMQTGPSYLAAYDKATGKLNWKSDRNLGAPQEAAQSYSTPVVATVGGQEQIFVVGADHATAHDASNGGEIWRVGGLNPTQNGFFRSISSPVVADGLLVAPYARGGSLTVIRLGGKGDVTRSHIAWSKEGIGADVPTPVVHEGRVYVCNDKGPVTCLDLRTGKVLAQTDEKSRTGFSSSPILAGRHLYMTSEDGTTTIRDTTDLKVIGTGTLDEPTVATPVLVDGQILLRTYEHLYCIGGGKG